LVEVLKGKIVERGRKNIFILVMVEVELIERKKERVTLHSKAGFVMCKGKQWNRKNKHLKEMKHIMRRVIK